MSEHKLHHRPVNTTGLLPSYVVGFVLSILFTMLAYVSVSQHWFSRVSTIMIVLLVLALLQTVVQLVFFLHIGREARPRWKLYALLSTIVFALIIVVGSIWIMYNLNYNMSPERINQYMTHQVESGL